MNFNEYQKLSARTAAGMDKSQLANFALGLAGESGEVVDHVKKFVYHGHNLNREEVLHELGDTLWYLVQIASWNGLTMEQVAKANIDKLQRRYPGGFSKSDSRNRRD